MVGSGWRHNICNQVVWSRVPPRAVPAAIRVFSPTTEIPFFAVMENYLRVGVAGMRKFTPPEQAAAAHQSVVISWACKGRAAPGATILDPATRCHGWSEAASALVTKLGSPHRLQSVKPSLPNLTRAH